MRWMVFMVHVAVLETQSHGARTAAEGNQPFWVSICLCWRRMQRKILTDSGGVQKEAYIFKVPCITLRDTTEWVETVENGQNVLVGANDDAIIKMANDFEHEGEQGDAFGDRKAGEVIAKIIKEAF